MRALVIDDSMAMRMILRRMLNELGVDVTEAADGRSGLDLLLHGSLPDVVLVDWSMPILNGYDFLVEIRKLPQYTPLLIIMVTSETAADSVKKALGAGANEYLMKPFTRELLKSKLILMGLAFPEPGELKAETP